MSTKIKVNKPTPIEIDKELATFDKFADLGSTIQLLEAGKQVVIYRVYGDGIVLLKALHKHLASKMPNKSFKEQRAYRSAYHKLSNLILVEIVQHKLAVKKSPTIGWLEKLYPENGEFLLPFPQIQGLNSSWQWYTNGVALPVLRNKIFPYYGTYFPTRFDHLILFDNWLKRYEGPKKSAIDVGVGSGVLSLQLVKYGFQKVFASDSNPNAIIGLREYMGETKLSRKLELDFGHLFAVWEKQTELIVFNPPWLPEMREVDSADDAIYYDKALFPEFFEEAKKRLLPEGKLLIIFSNLAKITKVTNEHPIEEELAKGGRFKLEKCLTRPVKAASEKTKRDQHWRAEEEVELWILTHQ